jgi:hypothetical protein
MNKKRILLGILVVIAVLQFFQIDKKKPTRGSVEGFHCDDKSANRSS